MCGELYLEGRDGVDGKECFRMQRWMALQHEGEVFPIDHEEVPVPR